MPAVDGIWISFCVRKDTTVKEPLAVVRAEIKEGEVPISEASRVGEWESGRVGEWESGRVGEWESGRVGEWESGRVGEWESGRVVENLETGDRNE
ncbi:hypothetical protein GCM10023156_10230 [Novipirellula rosea]|uniref:Uncharacterized protein n=1 Tax=Novipirellula rosea TaxID=1031540 RepID=A0ABP8MFC5_9BACT